MNLVDALNPQRRKCSESHVQGDSRNLHAACGDRCPASAGVKCSPAVGAATEPRSREKTVW